MENVVEILAGGGIEKAFESLNIVAKNTYKQALDKDEPNCAGSGLEVWELGSSDYKRLCDLVDWPDDWGFWCYSDGSLAGTANDSVVINDMAVLAWRKERDPEIDELDCEPFTYSSLLEYFSLRMGVSLERNICALASDMAKQNGMTMGELFARLQGVQ